MAEYDLAIIGGGINGAGLARDAAGRGLRVLLCEQSDLASGTSSASTKLIHGGLRYLEYGELRLVREALAERERLLRIAPHLVQPLRLVLPVRPGGRPAWLLRLGLFLYDRLGGRGVLPGTQRLDLTHDETGLPLQRRYRAGFAFSDCWVDDARLVVLNAVDAAERGAVIRTRTKVVRAERDSEWRLILNSQGRRDVATARVLVNAAGPWAGIVAQTVIRQDGRTPLRLVKGSHLVVRKLFDHSSGYVFQNEDGRVVFALPFGEDCTLIGTTDEDFAGDLDALAPSAEEVLYLCRAVSAYVRKPVTPEDVVWTFAGVRSLYDDGERRAQAVTRDYHLALDARFREAPLLTIYGGKITTYRRLAEAALDRLSHYFHMRQREWTADVPLPGGDFPWNGIGALTAKARSEWPHLDGMQADRLVRAYGTRLCRVLGESGASAGEPAFGPLTASEVRYLMRHEWARNADDVLWRRTRLGLLLSPDQREALARFMAGETAGAITGAMT